MKFSLSWIREFTEITEQPAELARRLTSAGLPVETVSSTNDGDAVLDIEIFPNRPDCLSVYGIAREVAAITGRSLCPYPAAVGEPSESVAAASLAKVTIEAQDLCGRYSARLMQGVRVAPSPDWLAGRLMTVGLRPVNNIVDATNYVLWEFGQPQHAFDFDTLQGREIRVRRARKGEPIRTLDGVARTLDPDMLAIADAARPVAIAGVMGGAATMVTEKTVNLLLESASFDPTSVRRTSKRLGLATDASYRFERGTDIEATVAALNRLADLIQQVAGGTICAGVLDMRPAPAGVRRLRLRPERLDLLLGIHVEPGTILKTLQALQFIVVLCGEEFDVEVPSHRRDIEREVDLVEEVARSLGYENVPERLPNIAGTGGIGRTGHRREESIRRGLEAAGCSEAVTYSFAASSDDWGLRQRLGAEEPAIEPIQISNPIAADLEILRTTLLPGLLGAVARNLNRGQRDVRLYEVGHVFRRGPTAPPPHDERKHAPIGPVEESASLGLAVTGRARPAHWMEPPREVTFYDMKGLIEAALAEPGVAVAVEPLASSEALDLSRSAVVVCHADGVSRRVGRIGALTRAWRERFDIRQDVFVAELDLNRLFSLPEMVATFAPLPRYPSVSRDLSLIVSESRSYREVEETIRAVAPDRIVGVSLFDRYRGSELPAGTVGLSVSVVYQHPERTLASEEVMELQQRILKALEDRLEVRLRA